MKHVVFLNTKGGVGKSTLCEFSARELNRTGHAVSVGNTDQQLHVTLSEIDDEDFCLYDTAGAFTGENMELLRDASSENTLIIVPLLTSKNDFKEVPFLTAKLKELGLINRTKFVFTNVRANSKSLIDRRAQMKDLGLDVVQWTMPTLEDFREQRDTSRTRNEISRFINEVIL